MGSDDPTPKPLTHEPLWERQPEETPEAWDAFVNARDHDDRTIRATAERIGKSTSLLATWSVRWSWQRRFEAYDRHLDREHRARLERLRIKAAERHAKAAGLFQEVLEAPVKVLAKKLNVSVQDLEAMTVAQLQAFVKESASAYKTVVDVVRLALGAETEHVHHSGGLDVSALRKAYDEAFDAERPNPEQDSAAAHKSPSASVHVPAKVSPQSSGAEQNPKK